MPTFSSRSLSRLESCDERLQAILMEAIEVMDFTVLCGHRGHEEQQKAFREGNSKVQWPDSKHNLYPSVAVDIAPYPIDWNKIERFYELAGVIKAIAHRKQIPIKWGGDFRSFFDGPHFELA